jgi:hypothetical protein
MFVDMRQRGTKVKELLDDLEKVIPAHLYVTERMWKAAGGAFYSLDLLANAAIHRSSNLVSGFSLLLKHDNFTSAAPLVRLQLDNCLRFYAAFLVDKPHDFACAVMKGTPVKKMKSSSNEKMTDSFLVEALAKEEPWVTNVYSRASGYVHLSEKHFSGTMSLKEDEERVIQLSVGTGDSAISDAAYCEAIQCFKHISIKFLSLIVRWTETKDDAVPRKNA